MSKMPRIESCSGPNRASACSMMYTPSLWLSSSFLCSACSSDQSMTSAAGFTALQAHPSGGSAPAQPPLACRSGLPGHGQMLCRTAALPRCPGAISAQA